MAPVGLLVFLNVYRKDPQAYDFHPEVIRVLYFPQGTEVFDLAKSFKDNTRIANKGREGFIWLRVYV